MHKREIETKKNKKTTHSTVVSDSVTANQTPLQTPASYQATPLHFMVPLLKATTDQ